MANVLLFLSILSLAAIFTAPGFSMASRYGLALFFLLLAGLAFVWAKKKNQPLKTLYYLTSQNVNPWREVLCFCLLTTCGVTLTVLPQSGFQAQWADSDLVIIGSNVVPSQQYHLTPSKMNDQTLWMDAALFRCSGWVTTLKLSQGLLFYANHGDVNWLLNDKPIASINNDDSNRYVYLPLEIEPGLHKLTFESNSPVPPPHMYVATIEGDQNRPQIIEGVYSQPISIDPFLLRILDTSLAIGLFLAVFGFIPRLNAIFANLDRLYLTMPIGLVVMVAVALFFIGQIDVSHLFTGSLSFEADEAAFGVMAQQLAQGELPPLFHYGQAYQGTIEAYPLALLLSMFGTGALQWLSVLLCIVFILTTFVCALRLGSLSLGVFTVIVLFLSGPHFYWISSKAWFGYSFSLACGGLMMWCAIDCWLLERLRPGAALLWGLTAGLSLYALPLSAPFVLASAFIIAFSVFKISPKPSHSFASILIAVLTCLVCLAPYLPSSTDSSATQFLTEGRQLPEMRVENEHPLIDRFLGECLPVLLGARAPYDQQNDLSNVMFPALPSLVFVISIGVLLIAGKPASALSCLWFRRTLAGFSLFTIFLVSYSPFGVWPWYAIALYWVLPFSLYWFLLTIWNQSRGAALIIGIAYFASMWSASTFDSKRLNNPSSLSLDGVIVNTDFQPAIDAAKQHNIKRLIADSGFDSTPIDAGRDWIGESLLYVSEGSLVSVDRLSRRFASHANVSINSRNVGYLFHENFYYNNPSLESVERYIPLTIESLRELFREDGLDYQHISLDGYELFIPNETHTNMNKAAWTVNSNNPVFLDAAFDHNISVRGYGRDTYWSSGEVPSVGGWIEIEFGDSKPIRRAVLFHGTKKFDYLHENNVKTRDRQGVWHDVGSFSYNQAMRSSVLNLDNGIECDALRIEFARPEDGSWLTIFELWVF